MELIKQNKSSIFHFILLISKSLFACIFTLAKHLLSARFVCQFCCMVVVAVFIFFSILKRYKFVSPVFATVFSMMMQHLFFIYSFFVPFGFCSIHCLFFFVSYVFQTFQTITHPFLSSSGTCVIFNLIFSRFYCGLKVYVFLL